MEQAKIGLFKCGTCYHKWNYSMLLLVQKKCPSCSGPRIECIDSDVGSKEVPQSSPFRLIGERAIQIVEEKNQLYGSAFAKTNAFLTLLFPSGVPVNQYKNLHLIIRLFDKMMRVANSPSEDDIENPWEDAAGYCILASSEWKGKK